MCPSVLPECPCFLPQLGFNGLLSFLPCFLPSFQCFQPELPWAKCHHPWNTNRCIEDTSRMNRSLMLAANASNLTLVSPVTEFWE